MPNGSVGVANRPIWIFCATVGRCCVCGCCQSCRRGSAGLEAFVVFGGQNEFGLGLIGLIKGSAAMLPMPPLMPNDNITQGTDSITVNIPGGYLENYRITLQSATTSGLGLAVAVRIDELFSLPALVSSIISPDDYRTVTINAIVALVPGDVLTLTIISPGDTAIAFLPTLNTSLSILFKHSKSRRSIDASPKTLGTSHPPRAFPSCRRGGRGSSGGFADANNVVLGIAINAPAPRMSCDALTDILGSRAIAGSATPMAGLQSQGSALPTASVALSRRGVAACCNWCCGPIRPS